MADEGHHGAVVRAEYVAAGAIAAVVVSVYLVDAWVRGALGASRNDDWAYLRVALRFAETGEMSLDGWTQMSFLGQAVLAWPFAQLLGPSIASLQLLVVLLAWVGLWASYLVLRSFADRGAAMVGVAVLAVGPIYGSLATSFMTDVPAFSLQAVVLLGATRLVAGGWSSLTFVAMCICGVLATSIREYSLVVLVVSTVAVWLRCRPVGRCRTQFWVALAATALLLGCLAVWRAGMNGGVTVRWIVDAGHVVDRGATVSRAVVTMGVLVFPIVGLLAMTPQFRRRLASRPRRLIVAVGAWLLVGLSSDIEWVGNYVGPNGSYVPLVSGQSPPVLPAPVDTALKWIGYITVLVVLCALLCIPSGCSSSRGAMRRPGVWMRSLDSRRAAAVTVWSAYGALAAAHAALLVVSDTQFFDRYLIVFVPVVVATTVHVGAGSWTRGRKQVAAAWCLALAAVGLAFVDASATLDGAKWEVGQQLERAGYDASTIDAGFEWFNFHQAGPVQFEVTESRNWWTSFAATEPVCVTAVLGEMVTDSVVPAHVATSILGTEYVFSAKAGPSSC